MAAALGAASYAVVREPLVGVDDANIYLAYGQNVAAGRGFVYNVGGEHVEGFTSLAWTLTTAAAYRLSPSSPERPLFVLSILLVAATWIVLIRFLRATSVFSWMSPLMLGLFVAAWCLSSPSYGIWMTTSLMETSLWSLAVCCGATLFSRLALSEVPRTQWAAAAVGGAAVLVRPEALAIVPLWVGTTFVVGYAVHADVNRAMRVVLPTVAVFAIVVAGLTSFRLAYFGYPLPNTYYAKLSPDSVYNLLEGMRYLRRFLYDNPVTLMVFAASAMPLALFCLRLFRVHRSSAPGDSRLLGLAPWAILSTFVVAFAGLPLVTGGDHFPGSRILQPVWPLFALPLLYCISRLSSIWQQATAGVAIIVAALVTANPNWFGDLSALRREYVIALTGKRLGHAMNEVMPRGVEPSIGVIAAGGVATTYRGTIVDMMGLNNVKMGHSSGDRIGQKNHAAFNIPVFWELQPDLLVPKLLVNEHELRDVARRLKEQDTNYLRGLLSTPRFRERYRLIVFRPARAAGYPVIAAYCRVDWLERHTGAVGWEDYAVAVNSRRRIEGDDSNPR